jgi:hypothetical protein
MVNGDFTYAISVLECSNDVLRGPRLGVTAHIYDQRQAWPDIQHLPHRSAGCAQNLQVQATW